jgi:CRP-like cAMP-binding protein
LIATGEDGVTVVVDTFEDGSFLGQTTLTRQPVLGCAYAVGEVTAVYLDRDVIATVVQQNPVLIREFGRTIEERRANLLRAVTSDEPEEPASSASALEVEEEAQR